MNLTTSPTKNLPHIKLNIIVPLVDSSKHSTFLIQKQLHDEIQPKSKENMDISYDDTVITENLPTKMNSVWMTMMLKTLGEKEGIDNDDAPIEAAKKMNEMIKTLTNKLPCKIGPWRSIKSWKSNYHPDPTDLLTELPEDTEFVES